MFENGKRTAVPHTAITYLVNATPSSLADRFLFREVTLKVRPIWHEFRDTGQGYIRLRRKSEKKPENTIPSPSFTQSCWPGDKHYTFPTQFVRLTDERVAS